LNFVKKKTSLGKTSLAATTMGDAAKSKPWMGFCGLFSACFATLAGFGFCCYIQVEWITLTLAAPFLLFGIGMDDTFVMLSAWRRTSNHISVPERMGKAYAEAGISITFTSLTNIAR
jgi:predicted RND superfamily exporter protein